MKDTGLFFQTMAFLNPFLHMYIKKKHDYHLFVLKKFYVSISYVVYPVFVASPAALLVCYWFSSRSDPHAPQPEFCSFLFCCSLFYCGIESNDSCLSRPTRWAPPLVLYHLLRSDPALALRLFPNRRLQRASSHGMGPAFGHKINPTASRQGLQPVSHLFWWIIRDKGHPEVVFSMALSKCIYGLSEPSFANSLRGMLDLTSPVLKSNFKKLKTVPSSQHIFLLGLTRAVLLWEEVFLSQRERKDEFDIFLVLPAATKRIHLASKEQ